MRDLFPKRLALAVASAVLVAAQSQLLCQPSPALELSPTDSVSLSEEMPRYVMVPPRCDGHGNTYFRFAHTTGDLNAPVTKISPAGETVARLSLAAVPDASLREGAVIRAFAVDNLERVYLLLSMDSKGFIAAFSASGKFENTIPLAQPNFFPTKLASFSTGAFLVTGVLRTNQGGPATGRLFSGIFDGSGELVKEVALPPVSSFEDQIPIASGPDTRLDVPEGVSYARVYQAAEVRKPAVGDDDNAYVLLTTFPPLVYVVAPDGTLLRELKISSPAADLAALEPAEVAGKLMVPYGSLNPKVRGNEVVQFAVYDAATGGELARYGVSRAPGGYLSCYTPDSVTFLNWVGNGRLGLFHAAPR